MRVQYAITLMNSDWRPIYTRKMNEFGAETAEQCREMAKRQAESYFSAEAYRNIRSKAHNKALDACHAMQVEEVWGNGFGPTMRVSTAYRVKQDGEWSEWTDEELRAA